MKASIESISREYSDVRLMRSQENQPLPFACTASVKIQSQLVGYRKLTINKQKAELVASWNRNASQSRACVRMAYLISHGEVSQCGIRFIHRFQVERRSPMIL